MAKAEMEIKICLEKTLHESLMDAIQEIGNKQYVRVAMKSGEIMIFEYRSFLEMNYTLQQPEGTVYFGEKRVLFKEQESCTEHSISMDNLQEIEFLGIATNNCNNKHTINI